MPKVNLFTVPPLNTVILKRVTLTVCIVFLGLFAKAQITVDFTADLNRACVPAVIKFTSFPSGGSGNYDYLWNLGNGNTTVLKDPSSTYTNAGLINVTLTVTDRVTGETVTVSKPNFLDILAQPEVDFTADDDSGCFNHRVNFTNLSSAGSGTIVSFLWNFGNGLQDDQNVNPSTLYTLASHYPVTLTVINSNGCIRAETKDSFIVVTQGVFADFIPPTAVGCRPPITLPLVNRSSGPPGTLTYAWDFGNGTTSNARNPTASYPVGGNYNITLRVDSDQGCFDTITRSVIIPDANIASSFSAPDTACLGTAVQFENSSRPDPDSTLWIWGDGTANSRGLNQFHTYTTAGTFQVKIINFFGSCVDSFSAPIVIPPAPVVSFTSADTVGCVAPHSATFSASVPGAVQYNWDFGDGGTGTGSNPTYVYRNLGNYTVRLTTRTAQGCVTSAFVNNFVRVARPRITVRNMPDSGCLPFVKSPDVLIETTDGIRSLLWDFGDGTIINSLTPPSHTYSSTGTYRFKLTLVTNRGCTDSVVIPDAIKVGNLPSTGTDFSATPLVACAGETINFTDLSPNPAQITGWLWVFGDGGRSFEQNPGHRYSDTGRFNVELTVFNNGCGATVTKDEYIFTYGAVARFTYDVNCTDKRTVSFRDTSINATTIRWDFGDGTVLDNVPFPSHTYAALGEYQVVLTATQGPCTYSDTQMVRLVDERAAFTINPNPLCKGLAANFSAINSTAANIEFYAWDFGSGRFTNGNRTTLSTYPLSGLYTTRLRITDINGCQDSVAQVLPVGGPRAGLGAINPTGCLGITVNFIDSSRSDGVNNIVTRIWDFGDGTVQTINAAPYQHTYSTPGTYSVKLKIIDAGGCTDSVLIRNLVTASNPKANFTVDSTESCPGAIVQFVNLTNQNGGNINNFQWSFGDGTTSVISAPTLTKVYTDTGYFSVKLKIRDRFGCEDSLTRDSLIRIDRPIANFTPSATLANCPPLNVDFDFTGHYAKEVRWSFGDGGVSEETSPRYTYNMPGQFRVLLTTISPGGCQDTTSRLITINGPTAQFTYTPIVGCDSLFVNFRTFNTNNVDSVIWDFGDGFVTTKDTLIQYTYLRPAAYLPKITLTDVNGCRVTILGQDSIRVVAFRMGFGMDQQVLCDSGYVQFTDTTTILGNVAKARWLWNFGDGQISTEQHPRHFYQNPGLYSVRLTIETVNGCIDSVLLPNLIRVVRSPQTSIGTSADAVCEGGAITFRGIINVADTSVLRWSWDFGNGQSSDLQNPPAQTYLAPGNYQVRLVTTNSTGCTDTTTRDIVIHPIPNVITSADTTLCLGQSVQLVATGTDTYTWLPPTAGLSCTDCPSPLATPTITTTYRVRGASNFGCSNLDSVTVTVIQPSVVVAPPNDSLCIGQALTLRATGVQVYSWSPATGLNNVNTSSPVARPTTTTTYTVTGSDLQGCFVTTDTVRVEVFPLPTVDLGPDITITAGTTNTLLNSNASPDVVSYLWSPSTGLSCTTCPSVIAAPRINTTYNLQVTNNGGCTATDAVTMFVVCLDNNLYMPNTFSPNGDGMNDIFYPRGRGIERIRSLKIFNRWGQMVYGRQNFNANEVSAGWDGKYRNILSPPDVYVYVIEVYCENETLITLKGDVMLVR